MISKPGAKRSTPLVGALLAATLLAPPAVLAQGAAASSPSTVVPPQEATDEAVTPSQRATAEEASPEIASSQSAGGDGSTAAATQAATAERFEAQVRLDLQAYDNFFQSPDGVEGTSIFAAAVRAELAYRVHRDRPLHVYGQLGRTYWEDFGASTVLRGGLRLDDRPHSFDVALGLTTDRPTLDVGDELERADVVMFDGEYAYRLTDGWELKGLLDLQSQSFEVTASKDNRLLGAGAAVRYRGFGSRLSPEVGFLTGGRYADDDDEDHSQNDIYVQVRSAPAPPWYLSVRFRHRTRDYDTADTAARNFERHDTRRQIAAVVVYRLLDALDLNVYYAYQDAESTLPTRTFTTQVLFAGLGYAF